MAQSPDEGERLPLHTHLPGGASYCQVAAVFAQVDLLDAQARVVAVRVEVSHLLKYDMFILLNFVYLTL